jgi:hypothetical protein
VENKPVAALRRWMRGSIEPVTVAVEACSFWPGFKEAIEKEVREIRLVHPQRLRLRNSPGQYRAALKNQAHRWRLL